MSNPKSDLGVINVLVERLQSQRLPRALSLKENVERGEVLSDLDLSFLQDVFEDVNRMRGLLERHPEYQELASRMIALYKEITDRALANEKAAG